nr:hypothetical protein [Candidatus Neomarinimicrobiota bacterium]
SKAYHSPLFQPHCTLFSPVYDIEIAKNIIHKFKMNPFQVPSIGLNQSINIWKAVYIELEKNNQLNQLYQLFNDAWPFTYEFNPHISLIYKTTAIKNRLSIIDNTHILMNYTFNRIAIVNTVGPVKDWDIEYQVNWNK